jgi:hypothetical protein
MIKKSIEVSFLLIYIITYLTKNIENGRNGTACVNAFKISSQFNPS